MFTRNTRKYLIFVVLAVLVAMIAVACAPSTPPTGYTGGPTPTPTLPPPPSIKNQDTLVYATLGDAESLDPHGRMTPPAVAFFRMFMNHSSSTSATRLTNT